MKLAISKFLEFNLRYMKLLGNKNNINRHFSDSLKINYFQRFRFCGGEDCADWILAEIFTLSKLVKLFSFISIQNFFYYIEFS